MKTNPSSAELLTPQLPLSIESNPSGDRTTSRLIKMAQVLAKHRDRVAKEIRLIERQQARAHYHVGRIIFNDPSLLNLIEPQLRHRLTESKSALADFEQYRPNQMKLEELRKLSV